MRAPRDESGRCAFIYNEKHNLISAQHLSHSALPRRPTARSKLINNYVLSQVQRFRALSTRANIFGTALRFAREMQTRREAEAACESREETPPLPVRAMLWAQPFPFSPLDRAPLCALSRFRAVLSEKSVYSSRRQQTAYSERRALEIPRRCLSSSSSSHRWCAPASQQ